jgi:hypothetical protein
MYCNTMISVNTRKIELIPGSIVVALLICACFPYSSFESMYYTKSFVGKPSEYQIIPQTCVIKYTGNVVCFNVKIIFESEDNSKSCHLFGQKSYSQEDAMTYAKFYYKPDAEYTLYYDGDICSTKRHTYIYYQSVLIVFSVSFTIFLGLIIFFL